MKKISLFLLVSGLTFNTFSMEQEGTKSQEEVPTPVTMHRHSHNHEMAQVVNLVCDRCCSGVGAYFCGQLAIRSCPQVEVMEANPFSAIPCLLCSVATTFFAKRAVFGSKKK